MNKILEVIRAIFIGMVVAPFLFNTSRVLKAIELWKECLILFQNKALKKKPELVDLGCRSLYFDMLMGYVLINDPTSAVQCCRNLLVVLHRRGERAQEGQLAFKLATLYEHQNKYGQAKDFYEKALSIMVEIGERDDERECYKHLGKLCYSLKEYFQAEKYFQKSLAISKEIRDRKGEAIDYGNLGTVYRSVSEYDKAKEYLQKALVILTNEIGDRKEEASCYQGLGAVYCFLAQHDEAKEYLQKALEISTAINDMKGVALCYGDLGTVFLSLTEYTKAKEYIQKAIAIEKQVGVGQRRLAKSYLNLASAFRNLDEYTKAKEYDTKALTMSKEIGDIEIEFACHVHLAWDMLLEGNLREAFSNLFSSIEKCEDMRTFLRNNEQFKISFLEERVFSYRVLSALLIGVWNYCGALYVEELARARALADLLSAQYFVENQQSYNDSNPHFWAGIEKIIKKENGCTCLYISYFDEDILLWVLNANKPILFRRINVNDCIKNKESVIRRNVDEVFGNETFRSSVHLPQEHCEDRSLFPSNASHPTRYSSQEDRLAVLRLVLEEEDENQQPDPTLSQVYKMLVAPVAALLDEPELIIVPDRALYKVPFAALIDDGGKYLSENFRIRIVPSLKTLKLIQDSPADYHTGALIVGEPKVSQVFYKGRVETLCPLPAARKEAEMIGRLLGTQPLLGEHATKQAVLQSIHSVSLMHFAAHGNADRGEIALAPLHPANSIPREDDYLLTMADILQVRLRAKLVVLSCCHSACGKIRSEGVIGIARAFLGSGARSVLVALWALQDKATEQFMSRFYEHLVRGESASESLHQAMKWMRDNGFSDVGQWAPFMLIGDNVKFHFGN